MQHNETISVISAPHWPRVTQAVGITPTPPQWISTLPSPIVAKHERTLALAQRHQLSVAFIGHAPAHQGTKTIIRPESDWAIQNLSDDPIWQQGDFPLPQRVYSDLTRIQRTGLEFEGIYIAHELPPGTVAQYPMIPRDLIMPPPPPGSSERLQRAGQAVSVGWKALGALLIGLGIGTLAVSAAALAAPLAMPVGMAATTATLDPILFGLHLVRNQTTRYGEPLALWYYLSHWTWEEV
jgi:hypothetical protein